MLSQTFELHCMWHSGIQAFPDLITPWLSHEKRKEWWKYFPEERDRSLFHLKATTCTKTERRRPRVHCTSPNKQRKSTEEQRETRGTPVAWCGLIGVSGESVIQTSVSFNVGIWRDRDKEKQGREEEVKECSLMRASSGTLCVFQRKHMRANLWPLEKTAAPAGPRHIVPLSSGMADESRLIQPLSYHEFWSTTPKWTHAVYNYEMTHTLVHCTHVYRLKSCSILSCSVYGPLPSHSSYTFVCVFN